jgi:hypothetical protein
MCPASILQTAPTGLRVVFVYKEGVVWEFMESQKGKDWHAAARG